MSAVDTAAIGVEPWSKKKAAIWLIGIVGALLSVCVVGGKVGIVFALLIALMLTGIPVSIALGLTVLMFLFLLTNVPIEAVALKLFTGIEKFEIMAIPFFILAGNFLTHGGVAKRMIAFAISIVGHMHGGLALAGIIACAMFALVCGSSVATVVAIGSIILPAMVKQGYPKGFGAGVIITAGSLGILMLPSIPKVIYAISTNTSIGALFVAGLFPGMLLTVMLCGTTWFIARKNKYPRTPLVEGRKSWQATISALAGLSLSAFFLVAPMVLVSWLLFHYKVTAAGILAVLFGILWLPVAKGLYQRSFVMRWIFTIAFLLTPPAFLSVIGSLLLPGFTHLSIFLVLLAVWAVALYPVGSACGLRSGIIFEAKYEALPVCKTFWDSIWGLSLVVIIIGGIYSGIFTATEAAAMSAIYAFIISVFVYKDMPVSSTPKVLMKSASLSAMLLYIITNAVLFSFLMAHENIPQMMADWILSKELGQVGFLFVTNILLLLAGNVMEPSSIILVFAPILFPAAMRLGIDPIHFGILIDANMEVGLCHPPVGLNLYVASGISKMSITELTVAVMPWLITMLVFLVIVTYWPGLSIWLPKAMGMM
jgi:C4-dicarboxylate transporter DctM subunit